MFLGHCFCVVEKNQELEQHEKSNHYHFACIIVLFTVLSLSFTDSSIISANGLDTAVSNTITEIQKVIASDGLSGDSFGTLGAVDGNTAVISTAFVFSQNQGGSDNWGLVKTLTAVSATEFN